MYNVGINAKVEKPMIHIAVCDDEPRAAGEAERLILETGEDLNEPIEISLYYSGESFARALRDGSQFDIILMDIELGGLDGIAAGQLLREDDGNDPVQLIYISSHEEYHMQLFDLRPSGFLKKPIEPEGFRKKLARAIHKTLRLRQQGRINFLAVQLKNQELRIPHRDIHYLESSIRQITLVTQDRTLQYYGKLVEEEQKLTASHFVRIHQSYIVNFYSIQAISAKKSFLPPAVNCRSAANIAPLCAGPIFISGGAGMNSVLLDEIIYLAVLPLLSVILHLFFSRFFPCRVESRLRLTAFYILYIGVHALLHHSSLSALPLMAGNIGLILGVSLLYRGSLAWRLYAAVFISAVIILSDAAVPLPHTDFGYRLGLLLSKLLMLLLVLLLRRLVKDEGRGQPTRWLGSFVLLFPCLSIAVLLQLSGSPFFQLYPQLFPVVPALLLAINLLVFLLIDRVLSAQSERSQRLLLEQQNSYYVNQYHRNREFQEEALRFRHDFNHILLGLRSRILSGEEAASTAELDALLGSTGQAQTYCNTGNPVIDSILDYKRQEASAAEIDLRLELSLPPRMMLDTAVISVILGNALDNALKQSA